MARSPETQCERALRLFEARALVRPRELEERGVSRTALYRLVEVHEGDGWRERRLRMPERLEAARRNRVERVMRPYLEAIV